MGQAQRKENTRRSSSRDNISVIYGDDGRNRRRRSNGSRNRADGRSGGRPRNGAGGRAGNRTGNTRRRHTDRDQLQGLELWELSRESENPRMMRLVESETVRPERRRPASAAKRRRAKRRKVFLYRCFALLVIAVCLILIYQTTGAIYQIMCGGKIKNGGGKDGNSRGIIEVMSEKLGKDEIEPPAVIEDFLELNDYSRPGTSLNKVNSIFVHYTANPGTSARQNRSYFANLAETHERSASAHFIIGYEGELIQCVPLEEQAYAVATRNEDSISIECCYLEEDGKFTEETYDTLVHTLAWLTQKYHLSTNDILRHYDCGGKMCPLYYVEHESAWERLLEDVENYKPESAQ